MHKDGGADPISDRFLRANQTEEMHTTLSKPLFRKGDRQDKSGVQFRIKAATRCNEPSEPH